MPTLPSEEPAQEQMTRYGLDRSLGDKVQEGGRKEQITDRHCSTITAGRGLGEPLSNQGLPFPPLTMGGRKSSKQNHQLCVSHKPSPP